MIYTPENTGRKTKVLCGDTGTELRFVFEIDTEEYSVKMYSTLLSIDRSTNETISSEFKYDSIIVNSNESGDYMFVIHGLKETTDAST